MSAPTDLLIDGKPVKLGKRIGKGGEGEVFALGDSLAVKIYATPDTQREAKLKAMIAGGLAKGSDLTAFPVSLAKHANGKFAGFTMRLVKGHTSLHELYSPGARKIHFPKADYRFTVRAASNIARAVAKVHELGAVIGDINHSGILISDQAVAALIDADSFQFGRDHLCRVGVPEYTPPELQGRRLDGIVRTQNHDAFGLAVVIFQLLFMGRHPFVGRYSGGDMPMEEAIAENRFAYSTKRNVGMTPPPGTCQLADFPPFISDAFEAAFAPNASARPTATQWVALLRGLETALNKCGSNALHFYPSASQKCIWCRMEQQIGILLFVPTFDLGVGTTVSDPGAAGFNLGAVWAAIERVTIPNPATFNPPLPSNSFDASKDATDHKRQQQGDRALGYLAIAVALVLLFAYSALWIVYVPAAWWGVARAFGTGQTPGAGKFTDRFTRGENAYRAAVDDWRRRIGVTEMHSLKKSLAEAKATIEQMPQHERTLITEHEANRRDAQLHDFLETFPIRRATIRGIGPAKVFSLASYGIDTAADCVRSRIVAVPGFGEATARPLLMWRARVEARFVFRAQPSPAELQEVQRIRQSCANKAAAARTELLKGAADLQRGVARVLAQSKATDPVIARAYAERDQARADLHFLGMPVPNVPAVGARAANATPMSTPALAPRYTASPSSQSIGAVSCPTCGGRMVKRQARRGRNAGGYFWGCAAYPRCRGTRTI